MRVVMDRLYASITALDDLIRRQRRAIATIDAIRNMQRLECAREHVRQAQISIANFEGDALPDEAPPYSTQTPPPASQQGQP